MRHFSLSFLNSASVSKSTEAKEFIKRKKKNTQGQSESLPPSLPRTWESVPAMSIKILKFQNGLEEILVGVQTVHHLAQAPGSMGDVTTSKRHDQPGHAATRAHQPPEAHRRTRKRCCFFLLSYTYLGPNHC